MGSLKREEQPVATVDEVVAATAAGTTAPAEPEVANQAEGKGIDGEGEIAGEDTPEKEEKEAAEAAALQTPLSRPPLPAPAPGATAKASGPARVGLQVKASAPAPVGKAAAAVKKA